MKNGGYMKGMMMKGEWRKKEAVNTNVKPYIQMTSSY